MADKHAENRSPLWTVLHDALESNRTGYYDAELRAKVAAELETAVEKHVAQSLQQAQPASLTVEFKDTEYKPARDGLRPVECGENKQPGFFLGFDPVDSSRVYIEQLTGDIRSYEFTDVRFTDRQPKESV